MIRKISVCLLAGILFAMPAFLPVPAHAQGSDVAAPLNFSLDQTVSLDVREATLYDTLKTLFKQIKGADFVLYSSFKSVLVTIKIKQPLRIAVQAVIEESGLPLKFVVKSGVLLVVPKELSDLRAPSEDFYFALHERIKFEVEDVPLQDALQTLLTPNHIAYRLSPPNVNFPVAANSGISISDALDKILSFAPGGYGYRTYRNTLLISVNPKPFNPKQKITAQQKESRDYYRFNRLFLFRLRFASATAVVQELHKMLYKSGIYFQAFGRDKTIVVQRVTEEQLKGIRIALRLLDVLSAPQKLDALKLEPPILP